MPPASSNPDDMQTSLPETLPLWPGRPPLPLEPAASPREDWPELTLHRPAPGIANGAAIIVCPGGGYVNLMMSYEGHDVARWLTSLGYTAVVLPYRRLPYHYPIPLIDVQRAVRVVRSHAAEWGVLPYAIGVLGFSAGGHLASMSGTLPAYELPAGAADAIDALDHRPNFLVLAYAVVTFTGLHGHAGSGQNLSGSEDPAHPLRTELSTHLRVTAETPPTFLFHYAEDKVVPAQNSLLFYEALLTQGIPAELHIYEKGGHGGGMGADGKHPWTEACARFLKRRVLDAKARQANEEGAKTAEV